MVLLGIASASTIITPFNVALRVNGFSTSRGDGKTVGVSTVVSESIIPVSYTHLTLPTIYSV